MDTGEIASYPLFSFINPIQEPSNHDHIFPKLLLYFQINEEHDLGDMT